MIFAIPFPSIDPVIFEVGVFAVRWYSLAYLAGLILGWMYMKRLCRRTPPVCTVTDVDDFLVWATLGVVLGGRLGIVLFYQFDYFMANPAKIIAVWEGGMSFHGGFLGVVVAAIWFTRRRNIDPLRFGDLLGCVAPIGLFFGRIANFINSELWGRAADVPWAVVFPTGGPEPRHPSQIYEALLEGALLFAILFIFSRFDAVRRRPGLLMGILPRARFLYWLLGVRDHMGPMAVAADVCRRCVLHLARLAQAAGLKCRRRKRSAMFCVPALRTTARSRSKTGWRRASAIPSTAII